MRRLIWAFVVRMWHKTRFRMAWPIWCDKSTCRQWKSETVCANAWQNQQHDVLPAKTDQPVYPFSLIRVLAVRMKKPGILSYLRSAKRRFEWIPWLFWVYSVCTGHYAHNFKKVDGAYWFRVVPSVRQEPCMLGFWNFIYGLLMEK